MQQLYYLNRERFTQGDAKLAFQKVLERIRENHDVDTITFLVYQQNQYSSFLGEFGFDRQVIKNHGYNEGSIKIQIHTVKTYNPSYSFVGETKYELLVAVGVPPKDLEQFLDKSRVKYWLIVPWLMSENEQFLQVHEAIDVETGDQIKMSYEIDDRLKGAIEWLKATSYPNEGYHHPLDENRLKSMANAIKHYKIPFEHDSLLHYCLNHGLTNDAASKTVEYFEKTQIRSFHTDGDYPPSFLLEQMKRTDWL